MVVIAGLLTDCLSSAMFTGVDVLIIYVFGQGSLYFLSLKTDVSQILN